MSTAGNLSVSIGAFLDGTWSNLSKATQQIQDFEAKATRAGTALTAAFTLPIALVGRAAIKSGAELDGLNRSMTAIEGSAEGAAKRIKILNEIAKLPGLNFKDAVQGDVNLRSAGLSAELAAKSMSAFGNALGILGKQGGLGNVNAQIQQMATKTQGFGADLKILKEWVPQVSVALQQAFGTTNADMIEKMGNTGKDVVEKLVNELGKLPKATGGIGNALENMDDAWFKFTGRLGLAIDKAIDLTGIFNKVSAALDGLATWFENLDPKMQKVILGFAGLAFVVGPILGTLGFFAGTLLPAIVTGAGLVAGAFPPVTIALGLMGGAFLLATGKMDKFRQMQIDVADGAENMFRRLAKNGEIGLGKLLGINTKDAEKDLLALQTKGQFIKPFKYEFPKALPSLGDLKSQIEAEDRLRRQKEGKGSSGKGNGTGKTSEELEKETRALLEELELKRRNEIADRALVASTESLRVALANLANERLKIALPTASLLPSSMATQMGTALGGMNDKMNGLMVQMRDNFKARALEIKAILKEDLLAGLNEIMSQGADQAFMGMLEWGGAFMAGAKGIKDFGNVMKAIFGDVMISLGKQMIVTSEAWIAFKKAIMLTGVGGLAIGAGLVLAGSALKASAAKGSGASYQQVPQNSVSNYQPIYTPTNTGNGNGASARISVEVNQQRSMLRGNDLLFMEQSTKYGESRGFGSTQAF